MPVVPKVQERASAEATISPLLDAKPSDANMLMAASTMHAMDRLKPASRKAAKPQLKSSSGGMLGW